MDAKLSVDNSIDKQFQEKYESYIIKIKEILQELTILQTSMVELLQTRKRISQKIFTVPVILELRNRNTWR